MEVFEDVLGRNWLLIDLLLLEGVPMTMVAASIKELPAQAEVEASARTMAEVADAARAEADHVSHRGKQLLGGN